MSSQVWWYTARSGGMVSWGLLSASVLWGLALSTKAFKKGPKPNWMLDLHRFLGGLAVIFTGVHLFGLLMDSYVHFGLTELLVPFASSWHPVAVAWGVVAMYLLLAVELTSLARKRVSKKVWRATHFLSFPLFALGTIHGLSAGTDGSTSLFRIAVVAVTAAVVAMTAVRIAGVKRSSSVPPVRDRLEFARQAAQRTSV